MDVIRNADSYHTLYCLSGLSSAQHTILPSPARRTELSNAWKASPGVLMCPDQHLFLRLMTASEDPLGSLRKAAFVEALSWSEEEGTSKYVGGQANRMVSSHSFRCRHAQMAENTIL